MFTKLIPRFIGVEFGYFRKKLEDVKLHGETVHMTQFPKFILKILLLPCGGA